ncbi:hypothetical protein ABBQ38_008214 [Trebouxia sp. C0009 RCD-2024]
MLRRAADRFMRLMERRGTSVSPPPRHLIVFLTSDEDFSAKIVALQTRNFDVEVVYHNPKARQVPVSIMNTARGCSEWVGFLTARFPHIPHWTLTYDPSIHHAVTRFNGNNARVMPRQGGARWRSAHLQGAIQQSGANAASERPAQSDAASGQTQGTNRHAVQPNRQPNRQPDRQTPQPSRPAWRAAAPPSEPMEIVSNAMPAGREDSVLEMNSFVPNEDFLGQSQDDGWAVSEADVEALDSSNSIGTGGGVAGLSREHSTARAVSASELDFYPYDLEFRWGYTNPLDGRAELFQVDEMASLEKQYQRLEGVAQVDRAQSDLRWYGVPLGHDWCKIDLHKKLMTRQTESEGPPEEVWRLPTSGS